MGLSAQNVHNDCHAENILLRLRLEGLPWLMLLKLPLGLVMGRSVAMMPNGFRPVRHGVTRLKVKRGVNSTCAAANAANDTVEHDHRRVCSVAVDSSRASIRIIFANGG
jgi:hypothetical protein